MLPSLRLSDIASSHFLHVPSVLTLFDDLLQCSTSMPQNYWKGGGDAEGLVEWQDGCRVPVHTESFCATQSVKLVKPKGVDNLGKYIIENHHLPLVSQLNLQKIGGSSLTWANHLAIQVEDGGTVKPVTVAVGQRTFIRCDSRTHRPLKFRDEEREVLEALRMQSSSFECDETDELVEGLRAHVESGVGSARGLDFSETNVRALEQRVITGSYLNFGEHVDHAALASLTTSGLIENDLEGSRPTLATFNYLAPGAVGEGVAICRLNGSDADGGVDCVVKGEGGRSITHGHFRDFEDFVYDMG